MPRRGPGPHSAIQRGEQLASLLIVGPCASHATLELLELVSHGFAGWQLHAPLLSEDDAETLDHLAAGGDCGLALVGSEFPGRALKQAHALGPLCANRALCNRQLDQPRALEARRGEQLQPLVAAKGEGRARAVVPDGYRCPRRGTTLLLARGRLVRDVGEPGQRDEALNIPARAPEVRVRHVAQRHWHLEVREVHYVRLHRDLDAGVLVGAFGELQPAVHRQQSVAVAGVDDVRLHLHLDAQNAALVGHQRCDGVEFELDLK